MACEREPKCPMVQGTACSAGQLALGLGWELMRLGRASRAGGSKDLYPRGFALGPPAASLSALGAGSRRCHWPHTGRLHCKAN